MLPAAGDLIGGKYRVVRLIGEGGMGVVYEARHEHLDSTVALKFLQPELAERPALVARFLQEARVSASIKSPHVTQVIDVDQTSEGAAYLVMELLEGESLEARLGRGMPLPPGDAVEIGLQILAGLEAAHARGVVHRDLKPDNVWLSPTRVGPYVKLLDFGIAKLKSSSEFRQVNTRPGSMMGTPAYMAPEQAISADQVDHRADLYSFGVILYEMLTGARPVDGEDPSEILEHLMRGDIHPALTRNPKLPSGLAALVDRLVVPDPDARPSNASVVRAELSNYAVGPAFEDAGRASAVPATLPPDDTSAPPFATATHAALTAPKVRTDSMPRVPDFASAPTALPTIGVPVPARSKSSGKMWVIVTGAVVAALGGAGVWVYMNQSIFDTDTPPMPRDLATVAAASPVRSLDAGIGNDTTRSFEITRRAPAATVVPRWIPEPAPTGAGVSPPPMVFPSLPQFPQLPPITIPSGLIPIPSVLPPFFRQLPGFAMPPIPTSSAAAAPAPTTPAPSLPH